MVHLGKIQNTKFNFVNYWMALFTNIEIVGEERNKYSIKWMILINWIWINFKLEINALFSSIDLEQISFFPSSLSFFAHSYQFLNEKWILIGSAARVNLNLIFMNTKTSVHPSTYSSDGMKNVLSEPRSSLYRQTTV